MEESTGGRGLVNGVCGCDLLGFASLGVEALNVFIWYFMSLGCDVLHVFRNFRPRAASGACFFSPRKSSKSFALVLHGHSLICNEKLRLTR